MAVPFPTCLERQSLYCLRIPTLTGGASSRSGCVVIQCLMIWDFFAKDSAYSLHCKFLASQRRDRPRSGLHHPAWRLEILEQYTHSWGHVVTLLDCLEIGILQTLYSSFAKFSLAQCSDFICTNQGIMLVHRLGIDLLPFWNFFFLLGWQLKALYSWYWWRSHGWNSISANRIGGLTRIYVNWML